MQAGIYKQIAGTTTIIAVTFIKGSTPDDGDRSDTCRRFSKAMEELGQLAASDITAILKKLQLPGVLPAYCEVHSLQILPQ